MDNPAIGLLWYLAFIFSIVVHEAAHAYAAMKLGDNTAYDGGQVTLDPIPHIKRSPVGTIVVPLLTFVVSGWMIGWASAPYNRDWARRYPDRSALMSLAGPAANLLLVLIVALSIRVGIFFDLLYAPARINFTHITAATNEGTLTGVATLLSIMFSLNLILFAFNLIPLPPLDGSGIIPIFLSKERANSYMDFIENVPFLFLGLFLAWKIFDHVFDPVHLAFINMLYPGAGYH